MQRTDWIAVLAIGSVFLAGCATPSPRDESASSDAAPGAGPVPLAARWFRGGIARGAVGVGGHDPDRTAAGVKRCARFDPSLTDPRAGDPRAVGAAEVAQEQAVVAEPQLEMRRTDGSVAQL